MGQAHQAVRQAATELGLAESALQHPSELGLRHPFTALAMGETVETVRSLSARDEAQSACAQILTNHDMAEPQSLTLLTGMLALSLAEMAGRHLLRYSFTFALDSDPTVLIQHEQ